MKREKPKEAHFCPKCKSLNVEKEITILSAVGAPSKWKCLDCGFEGFLFPKFTEDKKKK